MRFWKHLVGSMIRLVGVFMALAGVGSSVLGLPFVLPVPTVTAGVVSYLIGRRVMLSYGPYRKA